MLEGIPVEILSRQTAQCFPNYEDTTQVTFNTKYPSQKLLNPVLIQPLLHHKHNLRSTRKPKNSPLEAPGFTPPREPPGLPRANASVLDNDPFPDTTAEVGSTKVGAVRDASSFLQHHRQTHDPAPARPGPPEARPNRLLQGPPRWSVLQGLWVSKLARC